MQKRRRRKNSYEPHVRLHFWLLKTAAWAATTPAERAVLIELYRRYNGSNNGRIGLSVRAAASACNIAKDTATRALRGLQEKGFAVLITPGGFNRKIPHAAEWRLTEFHCDAGNVIPTNDFTRWRPPETQNAVPIEDARVPPNRTVARGDER